MINFNIPNRKERRRMDLLIATNNPGKRVEIAEILGDLPARLVLLNDFGARLDVPETGSTYAENAALKAEAFFEASKAHVPGGILTLADDSGLEVDALGGEPGLYSARYAEQPGATDADRRAYLLRKLAALPGPAPAGGYPARFRCTVAVVGPGVGLRLFEGTVEGRVIGEERGMGGFGYDPVFFMPEYGATMAELGAAVKNQISHRARALQAALPVIKEAVSG
jgi:XTP/dITP diphosphohydrolase